MIYRSFQDLKLSALGMGGMRLPMLPEDNKTVDEAAVAELVDCAMAHGINYYDTAWGYHGGQSEVALGKALRRHPRDSYCIADKFPGYDLRNMDKVESIFEEQLRRTGMEYFDFYLFHNVNELNINHYLDDETYGIYSYLIKQKQNGRIRHLGFSAHGEMPVLERFLNAYGKDMEFCQLQINWVDWEFQKAQEKVELMRKWNLPVWVMEPLRGGKLVSLAPERTAELAKLRPEETMPGWCFRFLQSLEDVVVTLSGMTTLEQLKENIRAYEECKPLNETELNSILELGRELTRGVPCTACSYCTTHCPQGLDIPSLMELYNEQTFGGNGFLIPMRMKVLGEGKRPADCLGCRSCEAVCPQNIKISEVLSDFARKL
ncbi:MAG: 4Fe-4S dicluster domain-containing protein [Ruminococcaceae bacterium]|nr:4Fe-4S dicluster domain-containing protein [Oscillospiraceae bacterium]